MTARDGGERPEEGLAAGNPVIALPVAVASAARPIDEIFPLRGDVDRGRQMQEAWRAFGIEMGGAVRTALGGARSPPQIAYAVGEIVHNFFRTRGVTLTSYELRRLVAELLSGHAGSMPLPAAPPLIRFADQPKETTWTGDEAAPLPRAVSDVVFQSPSSTLITVTPRESIDDLVKIVADKVRARLAGDPRQVARQTVVDAIDALASELFEARSPRNRQLTGLVLSELCGLGPIDRLWADRSIRSVLVNGSTAIQIERNGVVEQAPERFRDRAHLEEIARRLAGKNPSPVVTVQLLDGGEAVVMFPPAAPEGPVLSLRRAEPGEATLEGLLVGGKLSRPMADLLRLAVRSRLNLVIVGPERSGKTTLLAAIAHEVPDIRTVTLARHRAFRWTSSSKVELVVTAEARFDTLLGAAIGLRPDLLVIDSPLPDEAATLANVMADGRSGSGIMAAGEPQSVAGLPREKIDLLVSVGRREASFVVLSMEDGAGHQLFAFQKDGGFHRRSTSPSFAAAVEKAGYGAALSSALH